VGFSKVFREKEKVFIVGEKAVYNSGLLKNRTVDEGDLMKCPIFGTKDFCLRDNCRHYKREKCELEKDRTEDKEELKVKQKIKEGVGK